MSTEFVNADFRRRVVVATDELPWLPSPQPGVERRLLDRIGGEVARATSLVRYARGSTFSAHNHALGEEFLVLDGVFSDEHGDYPAGTYVRNPPGSHHAPRTAQGCTIFVKLRQMRPEETCKVVVDTNEVEFEPAVPVGVSQHVLFNAPGSEIVVIERLAPLTILPSEDLSGEEILLLKGDLVDEHGTYAKGTWIRNPAAFRRTLSTRSGATYWVKRGHLQP